MTKYFILRMDRTLKKVLLEALKAKGWKFSDHGLTQLQNGDQWPTDDRFLLTLQLGQKNGYVDVGWMPDTDYGQKWVNDPSEGNTTTNHKWDIWTAMVDLPFWVAPPPPDFCDNIGGHKITMAEDGMSMKAGCTQITYQQVEQFYLAMEKRRARCSK
jgi:hypothetical protein